MAVYPLSGKIYLSPTTAASGGTLLKGVVDNIQDAFSVRFPSGVDYARTGLGAQGGIETRVGHEGPLILAVQLRDNGSDAIKMLLSHLTTDGTLMRPTGGTATKAHGKPASFAAVVRPSSATELHLYAPYWRMAQGMDLQAIYGQASDRPLFADNVLLLVANHTPGQTTPSWLWGTAAAIDSAYSLVSP